LNKRAGVSQQKEGGEGAHTEKSRTEKRKQKTGTRSWGMQKVFQDHRGGNQTRIDGRRESGPGAAWGGGEGPRAAKGLYPSKTEGMGRRPGKKQKPEPAGEEKGPVGGSRGKGKCLDCWRGQRREKVTRRGNGTSGRCLGAQNDVNSLQKGGKTKRGNKLKKVKGAKEKGVNSYKESAGSQGDPWTNL